MTGPFITSTVSLAKHIQTRREQGIRSRDRPKTLVFRRRSARAVEGGVQRSMLAVREQTDQCSCSSERETIMFIDVMDGGKIKTASGQIKQRSEAVAADKAYGSQKNRGHLRSKGIKTTIPYKENKKNPRPQNQSLYQRRNMVERLSVGATLSKARGVQRGARCSLSGFLGDRSDQDVDPQPIRQLRIQGFESQSPPSVERLHAA